MNVIELNGEKYVKASSVARELGYTADYVGQLCRSGKVKAKLVGRSWYVDDNSIRSHKNSRYRSTKAKTTNELKRSISTTKEVTEDKAFAKTIPQVQPKNFYKKIKLPTAKYIEDYSELVPVLTEKVSDGKYAELTVEQADSKHIEIKKTKESYALKATKLPRIQFTGQVSVVDVEPEDKTIITKEKAESVEKHEKLNTKVVAIRAQKKHPYTQNKRSKMTIQDNGGVKSENITLNKSVGVVAMTRYDKPVRAHDRLSIKPYEDKKIPTSGRATFMYLTLTLFIALFIGAGFMFLESSVVATTVDATTKTSYNFNVSSALQSF